MPLTAKVQQIVNAELDAEFARLHREHTKVLIKITADPKRFGTHLNSGTHGKAIFDEICHTYELRIAAIDDSLTRAMRFQLNEPLTVGELEAVFKGYFEPEWSKVLEHSRTRLSGIKDGRYINETVTEASRMIATFRGRVERIIADYQVSNRTEDEQPANQKAVTGVIAAQLAPVTMTAYGRVDSREDMHRADEIARELQRLQPVLKTLSEDELSALSTMSISIGTFLHKRGHAFSVLPEAMLAERCREELDERKHQRRTGVSGKPAAFFQSSFANAYWSRSTTEREVRYGRGDEAGVPQR